MRLRLGKTCCQRFEVNAHSSASVGSLIGNRESDFNIRWIPPENQSLRDFVERRKQIDGSIAPKLFPYIMYFIILYSTVFVMFRFLVSARKLRLKTIRVERPKLLEKSKRKNKYHKTRVYKTKWLILPERASY